MMVGDYKNSKIFSTNLQLPCFQIWVLRTANRRRMLPRSVHE